MAVSRDEPSEYKLCHGANSLLPCLRQACGLSVCFRHILVHADDEIRPAPVPLFQTANVLLLDCRDGQDAQGVVTFPQIEDDALVKIRMVGAIEVQEGMAGAVVQKDEMRHGGVLECLSPDQFGGAVVTCHREDFFVLWQFGIEPYGEWSDPGFFLVVEPFQNAEVALSVDHTGKPSGDVRRENRDVVFPGQLDDRSVVGFVVGPEPGKRIEAYCVDRTVEVLVKRLLIVCFEHFATEYEVVGI